MNVIEKERKRERAATQNVPSPPITIGQDRKKKYSKCHIAYADAVSTDETIAATVGQRQIRVGDERLFAGVQRKVLQLDVAIAASDLRANEFRR